MPCEICGAPADGQRVCAECEAPLGDASPDGPVPRTAASPPAARGTVARRLIRTARRRMRGRPAATEQGGAHGDD
jgi:hypothetical protein